MEQQINTDVLASDFVAAELIKEEEHVEVLAEILPEPTGTEKCPSVHPNGILVCEREEGHDPLHRLTFNTINGPFVTEW